VTWLHWSVPDPVEIGRARAFDATVTDLDERIRAISSGSERTTEAER
jgi:hypothetical protein